MVVSIVFFFYHGRFLWSSLILRLHTANDFPIYNLPWVSFISRSLKSIEPAKYGLKAWIKIKVSLLFYFSRVFATERKQNSKYSWHWGWSLSTLWIDLSHSIRLLNCQCLWETLLHIHHHLKSHSNHHPTH